MIIGFIGDIHGRACHALAILLIWQSMRKKMFDLVVQVGDLGVMPLPQSGEIPYDRFSQWDPAVYDLCSLILAEGTDAQLARDTRAQLTSSILVVAGNHDEFAAIRNCVETKSSVPIPLDPHDLFKCVPDGFTLEVGEETIGFCEGGDPEALQHNHPKDIDILVSHEGGFGVGADADNLAEGPHDLLEYLRTSKPRYHVFGHFHHPGALGVDIRPDCQGQGYSREILLAMKHIADCHGFSFLIAPVRPTFKDRYPLTKIDDYIAWKREDGQPFDPWIRVHWKIGGRIARAAPKSMSVRGTVNDWEKWTDMSFPTSGEYVVPGALAPVSIDRENNVGYHEEPNVWIIHDV